jgi:hypothetical protein
MGLDVSHGAWHGAYSAFHRWRLKLATLAHIPLHRMEGYYRELPEDQDRAPVLPLTWESLPPDPLHILLEHSDCDGDIAPEDCAKLADRLEELLPLLPNEDDDWRNKTQRFIDGLRLATSRNEPLEFL